MAQAADILIVGGGIVGISIAFELLGTGARILLLDRGLVGGEASGDAAGLLAPQAEAIEPGPMLDLCLMSREMFGPLGMRLREETGVDIEYDRNGTLLLLFTEEDEAWAERVVAVQRARGLRVERWSAAEARKAEPGVSPALAGALYYPDDHQVANDRLVRAMAMVLARRGVRILEGRPVTGFAVAGDRAVAVHSLDETFAAGQVVLAAGAWTGEFGEMLEHSLPVRPARGQLVALQSDGTLLRHIIYSRGGYVVPRSGGTVVLGSTIEFVGYDKRVTAGGIEGLLRQGRLMVPAVEELPMGRAWAGLRPWSPDGLPLLGLLPGFRNLAIASGHFRNGILLAPVTAKLMAELLQGRSPSVDLTPFHPARAPAAPPGEDA